MGNNSLLNRLLIQPPSAVGINFGGTKFSEPARFDFSIRPQAAGIYVILVPDAFCQPRQYRAIYFGQAVDFSIRLSGTTHEKYPSWCREAGHSSRLFVSFYRLGFGGRDARLALERKLIAQYNPACNVQGTDDLLRTLLGS